MHATNIQVFLDAASNGSDLVGVYCGLIAIELVLKQQVSLTDHDVCAGLNKLGISKGVGKDQHHRPIILALSNQLRTDIGRIYVNGKDGLPRFAPFNSYPYIRYTRIALDGWPAPVCAAAEMLALRRTVNKIRAYLRINFGCKL